MARETCFRVASLNLWGRKGEFEARMNIVRDEFAKLSPDVIFLQEVLFSNGKHSLIEHLEATGYSAYFDPTIHEKRGSSYGNALLSRLKVTTIPTLRLSTPLGIEPRNVVGCEVTIAGRKGLFLSTHLSFGGDQGATRGAQLEEVFALAATEDFVVLGGDLNMKPEEFQQLAKLQKHDFYDIHSGREYECEYAKLVAQNANSISRGIQSKLDYIIYFAESGTDLKATKKGFFAFEPADGIFPSDHVGVYGTFRFDPR